MAEHDRLPLAPVLVEDLDAVLRGDLAHLMLSSHRCGRSCISGRGDEIEPGAGRRAANQDAAARDIVIPEFSKLVPTWSREPLPSEAHGRPGLYGPWEWSR